MGLSVVAAAAVGVPAPAWAEAPVPWAADAGVKPGPVIIQADAPSAVEPPSGPAEEPAGAPGNRTLEAASAAVRSFRDQLLGQSITLGVSDVLTGADLTNRGGTFESYTGKDFLTPAIAFNSASASGLILKEYETFGIHWLDTLSFLANYAQFSDDKQTVQNLAGGQSPQGFIRGDFLYGVALLAYNGIYQGERVNLGFRVGAGLGAAFARFNGQLDYSVNGQNISETFDHDYSQPMLAYLLLAELRIGHIVLSGQSIELFGNVRTNTTHTNFEVTIGLVTLTAGYAFYF